MKRHINFKPLLAVIALVALLCLTACSTQQSSSGAAINTLSASAEPVMSQEESSGSTTKIEMPVDFEALQEQNQDVYAWIYIPGTTINHPVVQNAFLDNYYLVHNVYDENDEMGAIYTQSMNMRDFKDPVTVIYGHTFQTETEVKDDMFGSLHHYEDEAFFEENPDMYIILPDKVLKYEIVSAYEYDNRHILNAYDFEDMEVLQEYFDYVLNPDSMVKNVRDHARLEPGKDRIVQLSTCTVPSSTQGRYIVTGVLVDEQSI